MAAVSGGTYNKIEDDHTKSLPEEKAVPYEMQRVKDIMNDRNARPLTILDISTNWQKVAFDAAVALCIGVPGLSLVCIPYIFICYSWWKRHMLFSDADTFFVSLRRFVNEVIIWGIALGGAVGDMFAYREYFQQMRHGKLGLSVVLESVQVDIVSTAIYVGSVFLGRILLVSIIEIYVHVNYHKKRAEDKETMPPSGKKILDDLHAKFPDQYILSNQGFLPRNLLEMLQWRERNMKAMKLWEKGIIWFSTTSIALGLLWMKLYTGAQMLSRLEPSHAGGGFYVEFLGTKVTLPYLFSVVYATYLACINWSSLMFTVMGAVSLIGQNVNQLLLFTAMPDRARAELWDVKNRQSLRKVIEASLEKGDTAEDLASLANVPDEDLPAWGPERRFDLTKLDDIRLWWSLRKYIQVDFLDESVIMDYCSCIAIMLLLTFVLSGSLDWMVHKDVLAPGVILSMILAIVSAFVVAKVLQACIDINTLLDRDAQVLLDAEEALLVKPSSDEVDETERQNAVALLRTISRKIENFDEKQQILGITVTTNVRNGWAAGMVTLALDALMKIVKPVLANVNLEDVEAFIQGEITFPEFLDMLSVKRAD